MYDKVSAMIYNSFLLFLRHIHTHITLTQPIHDAVIVYHIFLYPNLGFIHPNASMYLTCPELSRGLCTLPQSVVCYRRLLPCWQSAALLSPCLQDAIAKGILQWNPPASVTRGERQCIHVCVANAGSTVLDKPIDSIRAVGGHYQRDRQVNCHSSFLLRSLEHRRWVIAGGGEYLGKARFELNLALGESSALTKGCNSRKVTTRLCSWTVLLVVWTWLIASRWPGGYR